MSVKHTETEGTGHDVANGVMRPTVKPILDACCGSRMLWFDKHPEGVVFQDIRRESCELCDGRTLDVSPDIVADFRAMPHPDEAFRMVVFDPPHLINAGPKSWLRKKYGVLDRKTWRDDIRQGFTECFRVLAPGGFLVFKWNEEQVKLSEVRALTPHQPLFGHRKGKTIFLIFTKD